MTYSNQYYLGSKVKLLICIIDTLHYNGFLYIYYDKERKVWQTILLQGNQNALILSREIRIILIKQYVQAKSQYQCNIVNYRIKFRYSAFVPWLLMQICMKIVNVYDCILHPAINVLHPTPDQFYTGQCAILDNVSMMMLWKNVKVAKGMRSTNLNWDRFALFLNKKDKWYTVWLICEKRRWATYN